MERTWQQRSSRYDWLREKFVSAVAEHYLFKQWATRLVWLLRKFICMLCASVCMKQGKVWQRATLNTTSYFGYSAALAAAAFSLICKRWVIYIYIIETNFESWNVHHIYLLWRHHDVLYTVHVLSLEGWKVQSGVQAICKWVVLSVVPKTLKFWQLLLRVLVGSVGCLVKSLIRLNSNGAHYLFITF